MLFVGVDSGPPDRSSNDVFGKRQQDVRIPDNVQCRRVVDSGIAVGHLVAGGVNSQQRPCQAVAVRTLTFLQVVNSAHDGCGSVLHERVRRFNVSTFGWRMVGKAT